MLLVHYHCSIALVELANGTESLSSVKRKYNCDVHSYIFPINAPRAGRYTAEKPKRRYFCHTSINIEQKILYQQTDIP